MAGRPTRGVVSKIVVYTDVVVELDAATIEILRRSLVR
jgi:hypothetical protein